jgi:hypothetical protein
MICFGLSLLSFALSLLSLYSAIRAWRMATVAKRLSLEALETLKYWRPTHADE